MKKILLIEDNEHIRENTAEILELSNYEVIMAEDGKIGVEKALKYLPDLIICDIMMPVLDGYGVLHALHRNSHLKNIPFIFLTAKTERIDLRKGMDLGADDYLTKPFSGTELLNAVDGRLQKVDRFKEELLEEAEKLEDLIQSSPVKEDLQSLTKKGDLNKYKKNEVVFSEGNHPHYLYYIETGKVKVFKTNDDGKELVTGLYSAGDYLGIIALLEATPYKNSATALVETELVAIPGEDFEYLLNTNINVAQKINLMLAKNVAEKEIKLVNLAYNSLRKKVADALMAIYEKYCQNEKEGESITISRGELATIAGTAKESLIRTLGDFRNEKLIEIKDDGSILILDAKKLKYMLN